MIVLEYVTKFESLSRYASELIDTEEKNIKKFLEGLSPIIEKDTTGIARPETYDEIVKRTYQFEEMNTKIMQNQEPRRKGNQQQHH